MNRKKVILFSVAAFLLFINFAAVFAQQIFPAKGSLESSENSLWTYYKGKTKQTVKRNAPMFEKINENDRYLLDYTKIRGVELYLSADFKDNKLALLQIMTPFPDYKTCKKETKDLSRNFAEIGYALMGVEFDAKKQCTTVKGKESSYVCTADDYACVYQLCPGDMWALACSVVK
ncbi:MAG: hypothetical protein IJI14_00225 [Anaerolineaceae bacterium]|nr:hypothetical protein [Anaerolineaceae bacterium]